MEKFKFLTMLKTHKKKNLRRCKFVDEITVVEWVDDSLEKRLAHSRMDNGSNFSEIFLCIVIKQKPTYWCSRWPSHGTPNQFCGHSISLLKTIQNYYYKAFKLRGIDLKGIENFFKFLFLREFFLSDFIWWFDCVWLSLIFWLRDQWIKPSVCDLV